MKVTWYKMSEKKPEIGSYVWFHRQDYEKRVDCMEICEDGYYHHPHKLYWAYAEVPELPEEERHECIWEERGRRWECRQHCKELLLFSEIIDTNRCLKCISCTYCIVKFCPHCGKEAK